MSEHRVNFRRAVGVAARAECGDVRRVLYALSLAASFVCADPVAKDGDDVLCTVSGLRIDVRLAGVDAADYRRSRKCSPKPSRFAWCDDLAAEAAKKRTAQLIASGTVTGRVVDASPFKKGFQATERWGRPVVRLTVNGRDVSRQLLGEGLVRHWP